MESEAMCFAFQLFYKHTARYGNLPLKIVVIDFFSLKWKKRARKIKESDEKYLKEY